MKYIVRQSMREPCYFESERDLVRYYWSYFFYGSDWLGDIRTYDYYTQQPIDINFFREVYYKMRREHFNVWKSKRARYTFRRGPVPFTSGKGMRKGRGCVPAQGIKQQMNNNHTRAKRRVKIIEWDEWRYRKSERNWKSQRKTQYV